MAVPPPPSLQGFSFPKQIMFACGIRPILFLTHSYYYHFHMDVCIKEARDVDSNRLLTHIRTSQM